VFETNVFGYHDLTRQIIPAMRAQGHGRIINCSSVLGFVPAPWRGAYVASKFALEGLTQTLRLEMRDMPIDVVLIQPGPITSKIRENSIPHFEKWIDWEASPRADHYRKRLMKRLYHSSGPDRYELPAKAVSDKLLHALEAKRPKPCYYITVPTYAAAVIRRILPIRMQDRLLS
jgi:short-subunit dehydrogenase